MITCAFEIVDYFYANAVAFGWIETRRTADKHQGAVISVGGAAVELGIPLGRPAGGGCRANPLSLLPPSDYVTGEVIMVTGGR